MPIISKYSKILEPISVLLQNKQINLLECQNQIKHLISILHKERNEFDSIFTECEKFGCSICIEIKIPRIVSKSTKKANYATEDPKEYYKLSLFLPYIDSLICRNRSPTIRRSSSLFNP